MLSKLVLVLLIEPFGLLICPKNRLLINGILIWIVILEIYSLRIFTKQRLFSMKNLYIKTLLLFPVMIVLSFNCLWSLLKKIPCLTHWIVDLLHLTLLVMMKVRAAMYLLEIHSLIMKIIYYLVNKGSYYLEMLMLN